ncbi:MAG: SH3 domain-containing protein [Promethearchaeota archaeon]
MAKKQNTEKKQRIEKTAIIVAAIGALAAIIGAYLEFVWKPSQPVAVTPTQQQVEYVGLVIDSKTRAPIRGAKVSLVFQDVPPIVYTDAEGVYRFTVSFIGDRLSGRLTVEASDHEVYDRHITLLIDNPVIEEIRLMPTDVTAVTFNAPTTTSIPPTNTPVLSTDTPTPVPPTDTPTPPAPPTNTPTPTPTPDAVTVAAVNLRSGPGTGYERIGTLSPGQVLTVTGRIADTTWLQVNTNQMQEGWVINQADLVTLNLPTERIPIISSLPLTMSFQNFEPDNGTPPGGGNYFWDAWFTTCSFESAVVHEGSRAVRVDAHAAAQGNPGDQGGTMGINPSSSEPIDLSSATTLSVWVCDTQGNNTVELRLRDYNDALSNNVWSEMQAEQNQWTEITWPLSDFAGVDLSRIKNIELYEWWDGVYYFDAVSWEFIPPTEPPMPTSMSFQNFEPDNGTPPGGGNYFWDAWSTTCSFESAVVREGSRAVRVDAHAAAQGNPGDQGGTTGINPSSSEPIDLSSATTLSVWVCDTQGNNTVELRLRDYNDALSNNVWSEMQAEQNNWTEITWPLSDFAGVDLNQIKNIELYERWDGVYYFDAVSWQ